MDDDRTVPYHPETAACLAYNAYGDHVGWKNYAGLPMPIWSDLPDKIRGAWVEATRTILHLAMRTMCPKCKKRPAEVNDWDNGLGPPVCCECYESGPKKC